MAELDPAFEQQLAELSDEDWRSLSARVRPPTSTDSLKAIAAKHISEDQLPTFMAIANVKAFADEHGNVDEAKVQQASTLFRGGEPQQQGPQSSWGQHSHGNAPGKQPGDDARAALEKRHGVKNDATHPGAGVGIRPGDDARAALEKRHGVKGRK
jgi:hypothetical protein